MDNRQMDISIKVFLKMAAVVLGLWFLYLARDIVALFFLSVILTATLDPAINRMSRRKIPRSLGVIIIYVAMLGMMGLLLSFLVPPLISQVESFAHSLPTYGETFSKTFAGFDQYASSYGIQFSSHQLLQDSTGNLFQSSGKIFSTTVGVVTFFISILVVLAMTFYMSVKEDGMSKFLVSITPDSQHDRVVSVANRIKRKIGKWMLGQIILMLIIFVLDFAALSVFHVPYALVLALLAGLLEIVPYLGPIISATLASLVGFLISPITGLIVLATLTVIQQLESHIIVPQVMKKAVGLNPVVVILVLLVGAKLGGTLGAILSVPLATAVSVFIEDFVNKKEIRTTD